MDANSCLFFMRFKYFYLDKHPNTLVAEPTGYFFDISTSSIFWKYTLLSDHAPIFQISLCYLFFSARNSIVA